MPARVLVGFHALTAEGAVRQAQELQDTELQLVGALPGATLLGRGYLTSVDPKDLLVEEFGVRRTPKQR